MRICLAVLLLAVYAFAQSSSDVAAAACGPRDVSFDVKLGESQHMPTQPEPGKARVYFILDSGEITCGIIGCGTTKIGLDGTWVGAVQGNSYFSVSVEPGEHHACANRQSHISRQNRRLALVHFTAEAGSIYYFRTRNFEEVSIALLDLDPIDSDQGKYLIATYPVSVAQVKK